MRRTKIVATIGPATSQVEVLEDLLRAGMDVARMNFSHGAHLDHAANYRAIRAASERVGKPVAVLADLQGPKIRVGELEGGQLALLAGETVTITTRDLTGTAGIIPTVYEGLPSDVCPGSRILLDDGALELEVLASAGTEVECRVVVGGTLTDHKGINLPGVAVSAPSLTEKDRADLAFALALGVDYVALSFVRTGRDVRTVKDAMQAFGRSVPVVAKIEKPEAIEHFDAILEETDVVMIARGDLGVELPLEDVPVLQKRLIAQAHGHGVPAITATQMLQSMVTAPRPTRAEASDVANAIFDGTDAVMLSGETATGAYPVEAVEVMDRIARAAESEVLGRRPFIEERSTAGSPFSNAIAHSACEAAHDVGARGVIAFSRSGATARLVSLYRPACPIVAVTPSVDAWRRMALYWGVTPLLTEDLTSSTQMVLWVDRAAAHLPDCKPGDVVVVTSGTSLLDDTVTNSLRLHAVRQLDVSSAGTSP
jgi:pyruvate kinase